LSELFALLVSILVCAGFLIGGAASRDRGAVFVGFMFVGPTYAAARVMRRDWKRAGASQNLGLDA